MKAKRIFGIILSFLIIISVGGTIITASMYGIINVNELMGWASVGVAAISIIGVIVGSIILIAASLNISDKSKTPIDNFQYAIAHLQTRNGFIEFHENYAIMKPSKNSKHKYIFKNDGDMIVVDNDAIIISNNDGTIDIESSSTTFKECN